MDRVEEKNTDFVAKERLKVQKSRFALRSDDRQTKVGSGPHVTRVCSDRESAGKLNDPGKNRGIAGNFAKNEENPEIFIQLYYF